MVLQDSTGGLIPLVKDSIHGVKEPIWLVSREKVVTWDIFSAAPIVVLL